MKAWIALGSVAALALAPAAAQLVLGGALAESTSEEALRAPAFEVGIGPSAGATLAKVVQPVADELDPAELAERERARDEARLPVQFVHPLAALSDEAIAELVRSDLPSLGSMSVGAPSRGALVNAVPFPEGEHWHRVDPVHMWGTSETVEFIKLAIGKVVESFPDSEKLFIGDLSGPRGGRIYPHASHQSGRDVDLGFYYVERPLWYRVATLKNLDRARTWTLLKALVTQAPVEYVFLDRKVQRMLREYALGAGEDKAWVDSLFEISGQRRSALVRHRWGHATHMHVRFENPTAELTARRAYRALQSAKLLPRVRYYRESSPPPRRGTLAAR